jgi:hypothetical protein
MSFSFVIPFGSSHAFRANMNRTVIPAFQGKNKKESIIQLSWLYTTVSRRSRHTQQNTQNKGSNVKSAETKVTR